MINENYDVAIIDADSILYQIAHTEPSPALRKKQLDNKLKNIMETTGSSLGAVFIKGKDNFRHHVDSAYKGNRKDNIDPEIRDRINELYEYAKDFSVESNGGEADDYCAIAAELAVKEGKSFIICHIDKDLDGIVGDHYNFRTSAIYQMTKKEAYLFLMTQLLTGDATDNIQGIRGVGPKTAEKILKDIPYSLLWDRVIETWQSKQSDNWKENFTKCANCIYLRPTADDLRGLTFEELEEKLAWKTMDTGTHSQTDPKMPLDFYTTSKTLKQEDDTLEESS